MSGKVEQVFNDILVLMALDGDRQALDKLARRWWPRHYAHACRFLGHHEGAADVVQDAWSQIIAGLRKLNDVSRFPAWSYSIVSRRCYDLIRRRKTSRQNETVDNEQIGEREADESLKMDMEKALKQLPGEQRAALALFYIEGFNVNEIATALHIPAGTVKTRIFHARNKLKAFFKNNEENTGGKDHE
ncbi:MAG: RNA polymerase sigma factor [Desulfatiglans sp.]|jgi:RNA polymerase sigma-70 factor (ECF subfamily)|nr:RNA polymerase sigma factor [Desulfatiglans sp.]